MTRSEIILAAACDFLDQERIGYAIHERETAIQTGFSGESAHYTVAIYARHEVLGVFVRLPLVVPEDHWSRVAEAVLRANDGLLVGGFRLQARTGRLEFHASLPLSGAELEEEQFRHLLTAAFATADRYNRAFHRLVYGDDLSPAEVIAEVEMAANEQREQDEADD